LAIRVAQDISPALRGMTDNVIRPLVKTLSDAPIGIRAAGYAFAGLAAAIGPLILITGSLIKNLGYIKSAIPAIAKLTAGTVGALGIFAGGMAFIAVQTQKAIDTGQKYIDILDKLAQQKGEEKLSGFKRFWAGLEATVAKATQGIDYARIAQQEYLKSLPSGQFFQNMFAPIKKAMDDAKNATDETKQVTDEFADIIEDKFRPGLEKTKITLENTAVNARNFGFALEEALPHLDGFNEKTLALYNIKTFEQKAIEIQILEKHIREMDAALASGKISALDYARGIEEAKNKIHELASGIKFDAIPAVQAFAGTSAKASVEVTANMVKAAKEAESIWDQMTDGIKTKWTSEISEILKGTKSFEDGFKGMCEAVKNIFFDLIAEMIAKWIVGFVGKILEGGGGLLDGLKGVFGSIGKIFSGSEDGSGSGGVAGNMASSFLGSIGKIAGPLGLGLLLAKFVDLKAVGEAVTGALTTAIGAVGDVISSVGKLVSSVFGAGESIISGIGSALGGIASTIGNLANLISAGGKKYGEITFWLEKITNTNQEITNFMRNDVAPALHDLKNAIWYNTNPFLDDIKKTAWSISDKISNLGSSGGLRHRDLINMENYLSGIDSNTWEMVRILRKHMGSALRGMHGVSKGSGIIAYHPNELIDITPLSEIKSGQASPASTAGQGRQMNNYYFTIQTLDPLDMTRVVETKIMPILDRSYRANRGGYTRNLKTQTNQY